MKIMLDAIRTAAGQWLRYHQTLHALSSLGPVLRADLGLADTDLSAIAAKASRNGGPISVYELTRRYTADVNETPPVRRPVPAASSRAQIPARVRRAV
jgi:uncharacterized protein YjiS (DUF1127 family)